jgi:hypothetical protein
VELIEMGVTPVNVFGRVREQDQVRPNWASRASASCGVKPLIALWV